MQQLIIKLSPEATANYLKIASAKTQAEMTHDMDAGGVQLDINLAMIAGLNFSDIRVNDQKINAVSDHDDLQIELRDIN